MIILPIKKKWFDMIISGEKKEEYREIKPYWITRFNNYYEKARLWIEQDCPDFREIYYNVIFKNGYKKDSPQIECACSLKIGTGKAQWGAEPNRKYLVLEIKHINNVIGRYK